MKPTQLWTAGLFLFSSLAVSAEDGGTHIIFKGAFNTERIEVRAGLAPGDSIWESGASDPLKEAFTSVIFHGRSSDPGISIEGCLKDCAKEESWKKAEIERFPNGRFWGSLGLAGDKGDSVQMKIVDRGIPAAESVQLFEIEAASPAAETARAQSEPQKPSTPALVGAPKPRVRPRKEWGAEPPRGPYEPMIPVRISVHHTEGAQPMTPEDAVQELRMIQRFHKKGRGWIDIGYHFLIDGYGRIYQGRPETVVGAHVRNKNEGNVGISLMGSFQKPKDQQPTNGQIKSLIRLARWLAATYAIDPQTIEGHRDQQDGTSCPGDNLWAKLPDIRKAVSEPQPPAPVAPPIVRLPPLSEGNNFFDAGLRPK